MDLKENYRLLISAYLGIRELDEYDLKVYILKQLEQLIKEFVEENNIDISDCKEDNEIVKNWSMKTKLQDCLIVLPQINPSIELMLLIKSKIKELENRR